MSSGVNHKSITLTLHDWFVGKLITGGCLDVDDTNVSEGELLELSRFVHRVAAALLKTREEFVEDITGQEASAPQKQEGQKEW